MNLLVSLGTRRQWVGTLASGGQPAGFSANPDLRPLASTAEEKDPFLAVKEPNCPTARPWVPMKVRVGSCYLDLKP